MILVNDPEGKNDTARVVRGGRAVFNLRFRSVAASYLHLSAAPFKQALQMTSMPVERHARCWVKVPLNSFTPPHLQALPHCRANRTTHAHRAA